MEWFWIIVAAGSAGAAARWWRARYVARRGRAEDLERVRRLTMEDVTHLGEQVQRLAPESCKRSAGIKRNVYRR